MKIFIFLFGDRTSWGFIPGAIRGIRDSWNNAKKAVKHLTF